MVPILETLEGIVTDVNPVHPLKAYSSNDRVGNDSSGSDNDDSVTDCSDTSRNRNRSQY